MTSQTVRVERGLGAGCVAEDPAGFEGSAHAAQACVSPASAPPLGTAEQEQPCPRTLGGDWRGHVPQARRHVASGGPQRLSVKGALGCGRRMGGCSRVSQDAQAAV